MKFCAQKRYPKNLQSKKLLGKKRFWVKKNLSDLLEHTEGSHQNKKISKQLEKSMTFHGHSAVIRPAQLITETQPHTPGVGEDNY